MIGRDIKLQDASDADVLTLTAVTGWVKYGGGEDAGIEYQLLLGFETVGSSSGNAVSLVFGDDNTKTNLEYNEFKIYQTQANNGLTAVTYNMENVDGTNLVDLTGYKADQFTTNSPYILRWSSGDKNYTPGDYYEVPFANNQIAKGFWKINQANTKLEKG